MLGGLFRFLFRDGNWKFICWCLSILIMINYLFCDLNGIENLRSPSHHHQIIISSFVEAWAHGCGKCTSNHSRTLSHFRVRALLKCTCSPCRYNIVTATQSTSIWLWCTCSDCAVHSRIRRWMLLARDSFLNSLFSGDFRQINYWLLFLHVVMRLRLFGVICVTVDNR